MDTPTTITQSFAGHLAADRAMPAEGPLRSSVAALEEAVSNLHSALTNLDVKLDPILTPAGLEDASAPPSSPKPPRSQLTDQLDSLVATVTAATQRVRFMEGRVEL